MGWKDAPVEGSVTKKNSWEDAPIEGEVLEPEQEPSFGQDLARQAGLTARIGIEGVSDLGEAVLNQFGSESPAEIAINQKINPNYQPRGDMFSGSGERAADFLGLPKPQNALERIVNSTGKTILPAAATLRGAQVANQVARSPAAQRIAEFLSRAPGQQLIGATGTGVGSSTAKELGADETGQMVAGVAGGIGAATAFNTANKAFNTATLASQPTDALGKTSLRQNSAQQAIDDGYVLPPSITESGPVSRTLEGISGKDKTLQLASVKNQKVTDNLTKKYLKLPEDADLSQATLDAAKQPYNQVYEQIGSLPSIKRAGGITKGDTMSGKQALESLKDARYNSRMQWNYFNRSGDPEAYAKATALDQEATKLEGMLERLAVNSRRPELVDKFREARKGLAKIYTVEKAVNPETGNVDAIAIAKMKYSGGVPIDGELAKVAKTAKAFPDATRVPKAGYSNPFTAWDATFGGVAGVSGAGAGSLILPAARVGARYGILSNSGQRAINANKQPINPLAVGYGLNSIDEGDY